MPEMMEVKKQTAPLEPFARFFASDAPFFRGHLFGMNPFALMRKFTEELDRVFGPMTALPNGAAWAPVIEVKEAPGKFLVTAELPGLAKDNIKVEVANGTLTIEGERKQEKEETKEGFFRSERSYGKFFRAIPLPEGTDHEHIAAQFENGMLTVTVPVAEAKKAATQIPIQEPAKEKTAA